MSSVAPGDPIRDPIARRLARRFRAVPSDAVVRCVADVHACVRHLGVDATPSLVERIASEHLVGMIKSRPPSTGDRPPHRGDPDRH